MVEATPKHYTTGELENMTEAELEAIILAADKQSDDARLVLGRLLLEGTSTKFPKNDKKGINWIKEGAKKGHMGSIEYKVYYEIRYDKSPNLQKLFKNLETVVEKTHSYRAINMLAEFNQIQDKKEGSQIEAARYYSMSADQGCQVGIHWMGVFYHLGFGVTKNLEKAVGYLVRSAKLGNGQSCYQLSQLYSHEEGEYRDIKKAYYYFEKALLNGLSLFDDFHALFKANFQELAPIFIEKKKPSALVDRTNT